MRTGCLLYTSHPSHAFTSVETSPEYADRPRDVYKRQDYQTRSGLNVKTRELVTFSILVSLGGCESQVKGHIQGNVNVGNNKDTLLAVVTQLLPYIGYPRTLNAIACLNEVIPEK